jgi:uncharacterized protein
MFNKYDNMKSPICLFVTVLLLTGCTDKSLIEKPGGPTDEIMLKSVTITDSFWSPRIENNHKVSVMEMIDVYEVAERAPDPKLAEAVGYILQTSNDPELQARMDVDIEKLIERVLPDGKPRAWKNLLNGEMYSAGHFLEAAASYHQATGNQRVLDAAIKIADDIDANFGPGKRLDVSQHEELKIGLLKLYHLTKEEKYLNLAGFFMDERGHSNNGRELYGEYAQDHMPVAEQTEAVGHTVRATYLYTPLAELAALTGKEPYILASDRIWEDAVHKKTYLTGNIGTYRDHEDFGEAYELPNVSCWNETCASIGNVFWNHQLFSLHRDGKYIDMMETVLYNGFLSGVSLDGREYFYQNPLRSLGGFERQPWFGPNCCPPNVVRLIASLGKYIYAKSGSDLYVNLFIGSSLETEVNDKRVIVSQETNYPWEGKVTISVAPETKTEFTLYVRVPGWTGTEPIPGDLYRFLESSSNNVVLKLNGKVLEAEPVRGFIAINRKWSEGDRLELELPMEVRKVVSNENVKDNAGKVALQRGPIVYCVEAADNADGIMNLIVADNSEINAEFSKDMLGGVVMLSGEVEKAERGVDKVSVGKVKGRMVAIPYYAWANRGAGEMSVWLARGEEGVILEPVPSIATTSTISSSCGTGSLEDNYPGGKVPDIATRFYPRSQSGSTGLKAICDQITPVSSFDGSSTYLSLRPQKGNEAWVQYEFNKAETVGSVEIYWKDDKQYCQVPESWQLLYKSGNKWVPVKNMSDYTVDKDKFNTVTFEPVTTEGLRIEIKLRGLEFRKGELGPPDGNYMPDNEIWYETGIIEWKVSV